MRAHARARRARAGGATRFEFAVVCAIVAVLVATLLGRLVFYQQQAERVAVEQLVGTLRTALQMRVTYLAVSGKGGAARQLLDENPITWLVGPPNNYLGEYDSPQIKDMPRGNWYYDRGEKVLVYLVNDSKSFTFEPSKLLKFKVKSAHAVLSPADPSGAPVAVDGVVLEPVVAAASIELN
jgi:type II secretory pathway pseudopilin PulG